MAALLPLGVVIAVIAVILGLLLVTKNEQQETTTSPPPGSTFLTVLGIRLRYSDTHAAGGDGDVATKKEGGDDDDDDRTFVLVHGFAGCLETWKILTPFLSPHRVITVEPVGCGFSDKPLLDWNYTFREQGRVVAALLEVLDLTNVILVGHSAGAIGAAQAVVASGSRSRGAVFVAPGFFQLKPNIFTYRIFAPICDLLASLLVRNHGSMLRQVHLNKDALTPDIVEAFHSSMHTLRAREAISQMVRAKEDPYVEVLFGLTDPLHFVWAEDDKVNPPAKEKIEDLVESDKIGSSSVTYALIRQSGHYIQHEQPAKLAEEIIKFSKSVR